MTEEPETLSTDVSLPSEIEKIVNFNLLLCGEKHTPFIDTKCTRSHII